MFESISVVGFFQKSGLLFHIEGPMKENAFCPVLVFREVKNNFR